MEIKETNIKDCYIIKTKLFGDPRGFFLESFNKKELFAFGIDFEVKQVNFAKSSKGVLRGLHYQKAPYTQSKLVGVISGGVIDVAVDLRKGSPTFKNFFRLEIDTPETLLFIPKGCAHGYYTLQDQTVFYYAVDDFYNAPAECGINYNDPELNINWGVVGLPVISEKDKKQPLLKEAELFE